MTDIFGLCVAVDPRSYFHQGHREEGLHLNIAGLIRQSGVPNCGPMKRRLER